MAGGYFNRGEGFFATGFTGARFSSVSFVDATFFGASFLGATLAEVAGVLRPDAALTEGGGLADDLLTGGLLPWALYRCSHPAPEVTLALGG